MRLSDDAHREHRREQLAAARAARARNRARFRCSRPKGRRCSSRSPRSAARRRRSVPGNERKLPPPATLFIAPATNAAPSGRRRAGLTPARSRALRALAFGDAIDAPHVLEALEVASKACAGDRDRGFARSGSSPRAVAAHACVDRGDLGLQLGADAHDVLQQPRPVVGLDLDVDGVLDVGRRRPMRFAGCAPARRSCRRRSGSRRGAPRRRGRSSRSP